MYLWECLLVITVLCFYMATMSWHWKARRNYAYLPSYTNLPLLGNALKIYGDTRNLFLALSDMTKKSEDVNKPFVLWAGPVPVLILSDPDDIRMVANEFIEKPYYYNFANVWLGNGIFTAPGWIWKKNIKTIASTFKSPAVDKYQIFFNEQAKNLAQKLRCEVDGNFFNLLPHLCSTTLATICQVGLGAQCNSMNFVMEKYYKAFNRTLELLVKRGLNLLLHLEFLYRLTPDYKELKQCVDILQNVSKMMMKNRKIERDLRKNESHVNNSEKNSNVHSFLDYLLDISEHDPSLTEEQILWETSTIILAGQETLALTLFFTFLVSGNRKDVQDKMYEEIMRVVGDRELTKEDLVQLSYCEAVINESFRLFPPVPAVIRYADHDLQINSCKILEGSTAVINIWGAGRSKRFWGEDADMFRPERWLPPNVPCNSAHLPFSTGKRACIGKKYSMAFLKTVLVNFIRNYEIITEDSFSQMEFKIDVTLRPINGYLMKLRLRKHTY